MPSPAGAEAPHDALAQGPQKLRPLVLIINPGGMRERGGMGGTVRYLIEAWAKRPDAPRAVVFDSRGLGSVFFAPFYLAWSLARVIFRCATDDVALLHVNMAENTSVLRKGIVVLAGKLMRVPVLLHLHAGSFIDFYRGLRDPARVFTRWVFRAADRTVVVGEIWRHMLSEELGIDPRRIAVVYNGVPAAAPRLPIPPDAPCRLLFVGKLRREKGLLELFQALSCARLKGLAWTLTLVGDGARREYQERAQALGLGERVQFTGWLEPDAVHRVLAAADVYVLPSHYEGLPLGLLEALAAGLAVLTTRVGALPEILRDGESALLVPHADAAALEEALFRLVTDADLRARLSSAAHALYEAHFTVAHFTAAIELQYALTILSHKSRAFA